MNQEIWTAVDSYYEDLMVRSDPRFNKIIEASKEAGLPPISITANLGKLLELLVRFLGARRILEIGTLGGYSTAWLARGLPPGGKLITLEIDSEHAAVARRNLSLFEFSGLIDIRVGDALDMLRTLDEDREGPFDLIFIDANKSQYSEYLDWSIKLSRPGTAIIADNVVRRGNIIKENSEDPSVKGIRDFNLKVSNEPRLRATVLQTVSSKGYDGFSLIYVD
ncbi:MAG: O-methyltransferase, partial [Anaerolineales bacterium]|nr:O-methyltransferase [Anaerolineales bacterium]